MPKAKPSDKATANAPAAPRSDSIRDTADALCRAAEECYYQHQRRLRLLSNSTVDAEDDALVRVCSVCDETLASLVDAYEKVAAKARPEAEHDDGWWRRANTLWLSSREYVRRHRTCDAQTRRVSGAHSPGDLDALHLEFELEASALIALRQGCDDYRRGRPQAS